MSRGGDVNVVKLVALGTGGCPPRQWVRHL
jgi:hypothetical protein